MNVICVDKNNNIININQFFDTFKEFSQNESLQINTWRILKAIMRHPKQEDIICIADKTGNGYSFSVYGKKRTYIINFEIKDDLLVLTNIY